MADAFIGGAKMSKKLQEIVEGLGLSATVRVGFLENSKCGWDGAASAPEVAFINEYGAPEANIPSRPFMRITVAMNKARWGKLVAASLKLEKYDAKKAMAVVGLKIKEQIVKTIESGVLPENKESTAKRKKFKGGAAMTLQDSKNMKRAVDFEVSE